MAESSVPENAPRRGGTSRDIRSLVCGLGLAVLPFLLFWPITLGREVFAVGDLFTYNYPLLHVVAEQWRQGRIPLWNPYVFGGTPLLAAIQGGVFYPPNVVLLLITPEWLAYGHSILLQYSLCGLFTFLFLRSLDLSRAAATVGAVVYTLGGFTIAHLGHVAMLRALPWPPLILFSLETWRRRGSARHLVLGAIAVAFMLLAGHPQVPFYALVIAGSYVVWFALGSPPRERRSALTGLAFTMVTGAAIAGVQVLPTAFALPDYFRAGEGTYEYFTQFSFPPDHLITLLFPRLLNMNLVEMSGYMGIAPLVLAVVGGWAARGAQGRHRLYFVVLAAISLFLVLGSYNPLYRLLHHVPIYNSFRIPPRNWFEFTLAAAVLAGLGFEALRNSNERARRCLLWALVVVGLAGIAALLATSLTAVGMGRPAVTSRLPILALTLLVLGAPVVRQRVARHAVYGVVLLLLIAADLFSFGGWIQPRYEPTVYSRRPGSLVFFEAQREPFRILTIGQPRRTEQFKEALAVNYNAAVGVESLGGIDIFLLRQTRLASGDIFHPWGIIPDPVLLNVRRFSRFMDLSNTRYVLVPRADPEVKLDPARYQEAFHNDEVVVYENLYATPRFFWVARVRQANQREALRALASGRFAGEAFRPAHEALIEVPPGHPAPDPALARLPPTSPEEVRPRVEPLGAEPGDAWVRVESRFDGLLVHSASMSSGWMATIDDVPVPVYRTYGFLQGVLVPAGRHVVRFRYRPLSFTLGAATSILGLAFAGCILVWPAALRRAAGDRQDT